MATIAQENNNNKDNNKKLTKHRIFENILIVIIILLLLCAAVPLAITLARNNGMSKDAELITNLNTALRLDRETNHREHRNMTEALDAAEDAGYVIPKINSQKTNSEILWDSKNDVFVYYNEKNADVEYVGDAVTEENRLSVKKEDEVYRLWKICEKKPDLNYSIYWVGKESAIPNTLTAGFDAGVNEVTRNLKYHNDSELLQAVAIRTNSDQCTLTVDGPLDTVVHYGPAKTINVKRVAHNSYHERGTVSLISVDLGRIVIEKESNVSGLYLEAHDTNDDGKNDKFNEITIHIEPEATAPTFYRDAVQIADEGTLVCKIEEESKEEYIWLEIDGIYEQITRSDSSETINREWVSTSDASDNVKQASKDIANVVDYNNVIIDEETREVTPVGGKTKEEVIEDAGVTVEEAESIIVIKEIVKAYVEKLPGSTSNIAELYYNSNIADKAAVDTAYRFNAFGPEEKEHIDAFINAKKDGQNIFTMDINDYNDPKKINAALAVVEEEYGTEARNNVEKALENRRPYFSWRADYEVSFDRDIAPGSVALMGYYKNFADNWADGQWVGFGISDFNAVGGAVPLGKNRTLRLLDLAYNITGNPDFHMNYAAICGYVKEFSCGFANLSDANVGAKITVTLKLYELDENGNETGKTIECGQYEEVLGAISAINKEFIK